MRLKKLLMMVLLVGMCLANMSSVNALNYGEDIKNNIDSLNARYSETYKVTDTIPLGGQGYVNVELRVTHVTNTNRYSLNSVTHSTHFDSGIIGLTETSFSTNPAAGSNLSGNSVTVTIKYKNVITLKSCTKKQAISIY